MTPRSTTPEAPTTEAAWEALLDEFLGEFDETHLPERWNTWPGGLIALHRPTIEARIRAESDNPEYDGTDAAHPAWWRGSDHATAKVRAESSAEIESLRAALDECRQHHADTLAGLDPHTGPEHTEIERLRAALEAEHYQNLRSHRPGFAHGHPGDFSPMCGICAAKSECSSCAALAPADAAGRESEA